MTAEYKKRLIQLAREIELLQKMQPKRKRAKHAEAYKVSINSKINFLIGYILALEE